MAVMLFLIVVLPGLLSIFFTAVMYKTTALNTLKKTPSRAALKRYIISGYFSVILGIIVLFLGGFNI
jgi:hypothetical protein